jgi:hypothetical protein
MTVSPDIHDRLTHVLSFTQTENTSIVYVLRGWFGNLAGIPGALEAGDDAWSNTVMFEHYDSTLDQNLAERTPEQVAMFNTLKANAQKSQDALDAILGAGTGEDTRLNTALAAYVQTLLK